MSPATQPPERTKPPAPAPPRAPPPPVPVPPTTAPPPPAPPRPATTPAPAGVVAVGSAALRSAITTCWPAVTPEAICVRSLPTAPTVTAVVVGTPLVSTCTCLLY